MKEKWLKRILHVIAIVVFLYFIRALLITVQHPATGYESSIYASTPPVYWIAIFLMVFCGISLIMIQKILKGLSRSRLSIIAIFQVVLVYISLVTLHLIRSYYLWGMRGDPATHIGFTTTLMATFHTPNEVIYPITHIYIAVFNLLTNINIVDLQKFIVPAFCLLFVIFLALFMKNLFPNRDQLLFGIILGTTLASDWYLNFTPNHLSNLLFPILLFMLVKIELSDTKNSIQNNFKFLIIFLIIFYIPFHPVPAIGFAIIALSLIFSHKILSYFFSHEVFPKLSKSFHYSIIFFISVFTLIFWLSDFFIWKSTILNIYDIFTEAAPTSMSVILERTSYASSFGFDPVLYFFKIYGVILIFSILTLLSSYFIYKEVRANNPEYFNLCAFSASVVLIIVAMGLFFNLRMHFSPFRLFFYLTIIVTIFAAIALERSVTILQNSRLNKILKAFFIIFIIFSIFGIYAHGIFKLYPSPYTFENSLQTTQQSIEGIHWTFDRRENSTLLTGINIAPGRYADLLYGFDYRRTGGIPVYLKHDQTVPFHFGYNNSIQLFTSFGSEAYLLLEQHDREMYKEVFPTMSGIRWTSSDFQRLNQDDTLDFLYTNGEFEVRYIHDVR